MRVSQLESRREELCFRCPTQQQAKVSSKYASESLQQRPGVSRAGQRSKKLRNTPILKTESICTRNTEKERNENYEKKSAKILKISIDC